MGTLGTSAWGVTSLWFRPKYRFSHTVRDAPGSSKPTLPPIAGIEPHPRISQASHPSTPLSPGPSQAYLLEEGLNSLTRRRWHKGRNTLENFSGRSSVCGQHSDSHTFSFQETLFTRAPYRVVGLQLRAVMPWAHGRLRTHTETHRFYKCQTQLWAAEILE